MGRLIQGEAFALPGPDGTRFLMTASEIKQRAFCKRVHGACARQREEGGGTAKVTVSNYEWLI